MSVTAAISGTVFTQPAEMTFALVVYITKSMFTTVVKAAE